MTPRLDPGTLFDVGQSPRRRAIVHVVAETGGIEVDHLASMPAVAEAGVASSDRQQVATGLHHIHLPKLDEAGVVAWDRDDAVVEATAWTEPAAWVFDVTRNYLDSIGDGGGEGT